MPRHLARICLLKGDPSGMELKLELDEILVLSFLAVLVALGLVSDAPVFERITEGRLTLTTLLVLPGVFLFAALRRRWNWLGKGVRMWLPLVGVLAVYESLKHMHASAITEFLGISPKDLLMLRLDSAFFGKTVPLWMDSWNGGWFISMMWFFYIYVYYLLPVALLGYAYVKEDEQLFYALRRSLVLVLLGGYILYILVPVEGPLFHVGDQFKHPIATHPYLGNLVFSTLRYNWDCFPSLHVAVPWLLMWIAWTRVGTACKIAGLIGAFGVALSTVALRFHYGVDLIAGWVWAGVVFAAVSRTALKNPFWVKFKVPLALTVKRGRGWWPSLYTLFFATGAVGLLFEQVFEKMLGTLLGASGYAASTVLAAYFGGLTLGGLAYGRFVAPRLRNPLRGYGLAELGVGIWGLLLFLLFDRMMAAFAPALSLGVGHFWVLQLIRLAIACVWILPPTILMGISFPCIVDVITRAGHPEPKKATVLLYAINLAGAITGAAAGPYFVFPRWGLDGTLLACFGTNLVVFMAAIRLSQEGAVQGEARAKEPLVAFGACPPVLLAVSFLSGMLFFSLEVLWTHLIGTVLGNSVYAFSAMLTLVLAGLGLGGMVIGLAIREDAPISAGIPGGLLLAGSAVLAFTHGRWPGVPHSLAVWGGNLETFSQGEILRWIHASLLLLPPAFVLGMVYPLLFRLDVFPRNRRGAAAGALGAVNALGCISGALATGFAFIPWLGSEGTFLLIILLIACTGLALGLAYLKGKGRLILLLLGAATLVIAGTRSAWDRLKLTSGEHVYFHPTHVFPNSKLLFFQEDTLGGITTVVENPAGTRNMSTPYRTLLTNGKFQGNDSWEKEAQVGFALIPILFSKGDEDALVIGLGTGNSGHVVHQMGFRHIDVAEISPGIAEAAADYFSDVNGDLLHQPGVRLFLEDGRNLLLLRRQSYDLVTMEVSSVWFAGSTNLYCKEFYELVRRRLKPDGVFQQWIQVHHIGPNELCSVIATLRSVFPHVSLWYFGGQGILVATMEPQELSPRFVAELEKRNLALGWAPGEYDRRLLTLLGSRLLAPEDVTALVARHRFVINTDENRYLEYSTPRYNITHVDWRSHNVQVLAPFGSFKPPKIQSGMPAKYAAAIGGMSREWYMRCLGLGESQEQPPDVSSRHD